MLHMVTIALQLQADRRSCVHVRLAHSRIARYVENCGEFASGNAPLRRERAHAVSVCVRMSPIRPENGVIVAPIRVAMVETQFSDSVKYWWTEAEMHMANSQFPLISSLVG